MVSDRYVNAREPVNKIKNIASDTFVWKNLNEIFQFVILNYSYLSRKIDYL